MSTYEWFRVVKSPDECRYGLDITTVAKSYAYISQQAATFCAADGAEAKLLAKLFFGE